jgi:hypothetical protein
LIDLARGQGTEDAGGGQVIGDLLGLRRNSREAIGGGRAVSMLKQRDGDPEVSKAEIEFDRVQKVEDRFHKDFDGLDST